MKKILGALAVIFGVTVGVFVVVSRLHKYKIEAVARVTPEFVRQGEAINETKYYAAVVEAESELMSATVDEVVQGFRERFGVKK